MQDEVSKVYVDTSRRKELVEIQPEYVYMTIPAEYICIYHKILIAFADFGLDMLDDCNSACKDKNKNITNCFNMFNAAVAARSLGNMKLATNLIKTIEGQLNIIYGKDNVPCPDMVYPVDERGRLKAIVSCEEHPRFYVDAETGKLYEEYINKPNSVFALSDTDESTD